MRMFRKDEGFTLVELMVVVLIIGILVAVAIPIFNNASQSARVRTCHSNQRTIEGAVQQYLATNPTMTYAGGAVDGTNVLVAGTNAYLKSVPLCPSAFGTTNPGQYTTNTSGTVTSDGATFVAKGSETNAAHSHF